MAYSIKNNKPNKNSVFKQGYIKLDECLKYAGLGPIIYRSSWEKKFCIYCERTPEIISWSSESITVPYYNSLDEKWHKYFPDYLIKLKDGRIFLIEIKPKIQVTKPEPPKRKTAKTVKNFKRAWETWVTNMHKKLAAEEYARIRGWEYLIVDENFFQNKSFT